MMVGRGLGPNALAAVNLVSPLFTISTGIGLMFGIGGSVLASTSLGQNQKRKARMYAGQSLLLSILVAILTIVLVVLFPKTIALLFGTPDSLMDGVLEYLMPLAPALLFNIILTVGLFFIRLDGSPKFAMLCVAIGVLLNILLDYIFIFELGWGLFGAAFATMLSQMVGCIMMAIYICLFSRVMRLQTYKFKRRNLASLRKNSIQIISIGFPAFLSDMAISVMIIVGNMTFLYYLKENGVAAFSVICFLFPVIFMAYNAIIHSAQPIISHNMSNNPNRSKEALHLAIRATLILGVIFSFSTWLYCSEIVSLFLARGTEPYEIAVSGVKLFGLGFVFYGLNILYVGYLQCIDKANIATWFVVLRGGILTVLLFILLPMWLNDVGIWLAVPVAELVSFLLIVLYECVSRTCRKKTS